MYKYVPVLRWKKAEKDALCNLFQYKVNTEGLLPLIELIPRNFGTGQDNTPSLVNSNLHDIADDVIDCWGYDPIFFDFWHLPPSLKAKNNQHPIEVFIAEAMARDLNIIPVTGINRSKSYQKAINSVLKKNGHGLCVRLLHSEVINDEIKYSIEKLLSQLNIDPGNVDLIVDFQLVSNDSTTYTEILQKLPFVKKWRSLTFLGGSFPIDLSEFDLGDDNLPERIEWKNWRNEVKNNRLLRIPNYGDYTIQHPFYEEKLEYFSPSISIRYTTEDYWIIMRGKKAKNHPQGYKQYPAFAKLLLQRPEYSGKNFSYGNSYIFEKSLLDLDTSEKVKTGNSTTWLCASINHHISVALFQIANLSDFLVAGTPKTANS